MSQKNRHKIYETAFDSRVDRRTEESSGDLLDRLANHPILLLLNPRRRNKSTFTSSSSIGSKNVEHAEVHPGHLGPGHGFLQHHACHHFSSSSSGAYGGRFLVRSGSPVPRRHTSINLNKSFEASVTPQSGRRGTCRHLGPPCRSFSSHYLLDSYFRPVGLSKSDDHILSRASSDSPDDEDDLEDYVEGRQAEDLAKDLITLHLNDDRASEAESCESECCTDLLQHSKTSGTRIRTEKNSLLSQMVGGARDRCRRFYRVGAGGRGLSVDARMTGSCSSRDARDCKSCRNSAKRSSKASSRSSSILALHHPNINSPRLQHHVCQVPTSCSSSPLMLHHSNTSSPLALRTSASSSPRFSINSVTSSPKVCVSSASPSPRLFHDYSKPHSRFSSSSCIRFQSENDGSAAAHITKPTLSTSAAIRRILQTSFESSSAPSINAVNSAVSKFSVDDASTSGYSSNKISPTKSSLRELERSEGLAKLKPLQLNSPPGTAPLPVKFIKKTPLSDRSPSSWFSPPRQKELTVPMMRHCESRSSSSDASSSEHRSRDSSYSRVRNTQANKSASHKTDMGGKTRVLETSSQSSLNSSMEVLVDAVSERGQALSVPVSGVKCSSFSLNSVASRGSSMESLKSSLSEGGKSVTEGSGWRNLGSNSSLPPRPSLLLPASHRSLIQSAKFQILSPISDKSQEPSSTDTGGPIVAGALPLGSSTRTSPQDLLQQTPVLPRNISDDFRNVHHILPEPHLTCDDRSQARALQGSDSGIECLEKRNGTHGAVETSSGGGSLQGASAFKDLPFDMPKLRRRLAAARSCPSTSNSSLTSSAGAVNPALFRVQACECRSGTSSSNSSDWDVRSSSSTEGTPKKLVLSRGSLALDLGRVAVSTAGEQVDVDVPLTKQCWYHGNIERFAAEEILRMESEGSYLVRSIDTPRREFSLALKVSCGFLHLKIQGCGDGFRVGRSETVFPSVPHIIQHHTIHRLPIKGDECMFLLKPVISETL